MAQTSPERCIDCGGEAPVPGVKCCAACWNARMHEATYGPPRMAPADAGDTARPRGA